MQIYALLGLILTIFGFVTMVLTIAIIASKKASLYDQVKGERDALDKLIKDDVRVQDELSNKSNDELRKRLLDPW